MKKLFVFFILFISSLNYTKTQSLQWTMQTMQRPLSIFKAITSTKIWVFGGDIAYKSIDGGNNFSLPILLNPKIGLYGGDFFTYPNYLCFADSLKGWTCQANAILLRTTNGGTTWSTVNTGLSNYKFYAVDFMNVSTGWIGGKTGGSNFGTFCKTTNGGNNWIILNANLRWAVKTFKMINQLKGFATFLGQNGYSNDTIGITNDGGYNWNYLPVGNGQGASRVLFSDSLNGWVLGFNNYISITTNGGTNWVTYTNNIVNVANIFFLNNSTGWITALRNEIWKTTNGGINWIKQIGALSNTFFYLDIYFKDQYTGWAVSSVGNLIKSINGGNNWIDVIDFPKVNIDDICFSSNYTGWVLNQSNISKTINGGNNWILKYSGNVSFGSIYFIDNYNGFAAGEGGTIVRTQNSGNNWNIQTAGDKYLRSINFINSNTGWICGDSGIIINTTNSGITWTLLSCGINSNLNDIQFLNLNTGFIAGSEGFLLKTTNNGNNWTNLQYDTYGFEDLFFLNNLTGWAVGNKYWSGGMYWGTYQKIIKTTDGGNSWVSLLSSSTTYTGYSFKSVHFINENTGYVCAKYGGSSNSGLIKTTDGGISWYPDNVPAGEGFNCIFFIDQNTGWIGGGNGLTSGGSCIMTTGTFPIGIEKENNIFPKSLSLHQNYPNPFNPATKIRFDIPLGNGRDRSVRVIIYDLLGREVTSLVNETLKPGTYEVDWDGSSFASGVYFYALIADDFTETKKLILLK